MTRKLFLFSILLLAIPVLLLGAEKEFYVKDYFPKDISNQIIEFAIVEGEHATVEKFTIYANISKIYIIKQDTRPSVQTYVNNEGGGITVGADEVFYTKEAFEENHAELNERFLNIYSLLDRKFMKLSNEKKYKVITQAMKKLSKKR